MTEAEAAPVAVVTGGTRSIGASIVDRLLRDGWHVAATYARDEEAARAFASTRPALSVVRADSASAADVSALVASVVGEYGRLDHLVVNAAITRDAPVRELADDDWDAVVETNLSGTFRLVRAAVDAISASPRGRVVCISSVAALMGNATQAAYAASKAGLTGLVRTLARELAPAGVTANLVIPGPIDGTGMTTDTDPAFVEGIRRRIPLQRLGHASEVAHAVRFLLDDDAAFITGTSIVVDGGLSM
jgi:NAD(P)-dependent dehydrogenase (short-subunit alcohol dehydrogenase family)